jgi:hypothetical protein
MPYLHSGRFSGCEVGHVVQVADAALAEGPSKVKPPDEKEKAPTWGRQRLLQHWPVFYDQAGSTSPNAGLRPKVPTQTA